MSRWQALATLWPFGTDRLLARWAAVALLAGALGFLLFGTTPTRVPADTAALAGWTLPAVSADLPTGAQAAWQRPVWASQPEALSVGVAPTPQPALLGIVDVGGVRVGLFRMPDGQRLRAAVGERLPDGAEITALEATQAQWRDAAGQSHHARLLTARSP